jgi:hypothetical protein
MSAAAVSYQRQEFVSGLLAVAERSQHSACHRARVLLLDSTHHHAEVPSLTNHAYAQRVKDFLNRLRNLLRHPLLNLQTPRKRIHNSRDFAQSYDSMIFDCGK